MGNETKQKDETRSFKPSLTGSLIIVGYLVVSMVTKTDFALSKYKTQI